MEGTTQIPLCEPWRIDVSKDQAPEARCISKEKELSPKWTAGFARVESITIQKLHVHGACQNGSGNARERRFYSDTKPSRQISERISLLIRSGRANFLMGNVNSGVNKRSTLDEL